MEFQLTTLGTIALRRPDGSSIESILQQPRRLSLLVVLAMAGRDKLVRRDDLAAMFWPESGTTACRNALSQAVHYLRKSLSADAIITRGDEVGLNHDIVSCDAVRMLHGLSTADPRSPSFGQALDLYHGTFMPGLFDAGSPAFEQWVEKIRGTLSRTASDAGWARANALADAGEIVAAATMARRTAAWMEADEVSLRSLMTLLARVGDRAGALEAFDRFARMLETDYEMSPSAETAALAESIREPEASPVPVTRNKSGALAGPVLGNVAAVAPAVARVDVPADEAGAIRLPARRRMPVWAERVATVVGSVVVASTILISWAGRSNDRGPAAAPASLMVSGFGYEKSDAELAATSRRIRETFIHSLAGGNRPFSVLDGAAAVAASAGAVGNGIDLKAGDHFQVVGGITRDSDDNPYLTLRVIDRGTAAIIDSREFPLEGTDAAAVAADAADFTRYVIGAELDIRQRLHPAARDLVIASHRARLVADSLASRGAGSVARLTLDGMDGKLAASKLSGKAAADIHIERAEIALAKMWVVLYSGSSIAAAGKDLSVGLEEIRLAEKRGATAAATNELAGLLYYFTWATTPANGAASVSSLQDSAKNRLALAVEADGGSGRAWSVLAALHANVGDFAQAQYAAEQALREDRYARDVSEIMLRVFYSALENDDAEAAQKVCSDFGRTMSEWWAAYCDIVIKASGPTTAEQAASVKTVFERASRNAPPNHDMMVAAVGVAFAKAGMVAESKRLYATLQSSPMGDELLPHRAWLAMALGDEGAARTDLRDYVAARPDARSGVLKSYRFR